MHFNKRVSIQAVLKYILSVSLILSGVWILEQPEVHAQSFEIKWINVGEFQSYYSEGGIEPRRNPRQGMQWPAFNPHHDHFVRKSMWLGATNFTDVDGVDWEYKIAHIGPRVQGFDQFFPLEFEMWSKYPEPEVWVDGVQSFHKPVFNTTIDSIVPEMEADRVIYNKLNSFHGLTVERKVMAFSQEHHDNYHIHEYIITNTGNADADPEIEFEDKTLTGVTFSIITKMTINVGAHQVIGNGVSWGKNQITDVIENDHADPFMADYAGVYPNRAHFTWHGYIPSFTRYNNLGAPVWEDSPWNIADGDSVGRLDAPGFIGRVYLHTDTSPADETNDTSQPFTIKAFDSGSISGEGDGWDRPGMAEEYNFLTTGIQHPHHADQVVPYNSGYSTWEEQMADQQQLASFGANAGHVPVVTFGPYDMAPGESIRIVYGEGINGLGFPAVIDIGKAYKDLEGDDTADITFAGESMTKNEWVMTGRDSIIKSFERMKANFESGFSIPEEPRPPEVFEVNSGTDRINLSWEPFDEHEPAQGWELYRTKIRYQGAVEDDWQYELIAGTDELPPSARSFEDTDVVRGISYYYYIKAVGDVNNDATGNTPTGLPLKSNRYYTQTYNPAFLKRSPGEALSDFRIVPNPFNLTSEKEIRWPDIRDQIGFLDIPGNCTIKIFTERGDLVRTIEHTDGSGDEYWNLQTEFNQLVVSGVYVAVVTDNETGDNIIKKFVIIR